jgi:Alpha-L-arabinofuranosidase B (ABFB) domain/Glycosyl hydrolases family 2, sugar binding domain/Glycosyl hydrolases family 2/Glycosyl hydrolases family 2, TIM barrel domain
MSMKKNIFASMLLLTGVVTACQSTLPPTSQVARTQATAILTTPWTSTALNASVPLPEYPRPQMTRANWVNLNGTWQYWGGSAAPNAQTPPTSAPTFPSTTERIKVPFPPESYLSGIQRLNDRNIWYKRTFTIPSGWAGQRVQLNFGAVDRKATVYVNGQQVGSHNGGYDAFSFDITSRLRSGSNDLVVAAFDPTDDSGTMGKQTASPGGIFYTPTSGIWQTVWLEPTPSASITRLDLTPDVPNGRIKVTVRGTGINGQTVEAIALDGTSQVGSSTGSVNAEINVSVPSAKLWSPDNPFLYNLKVRLRSGTTVVDEVSSYFGMRSIGIGTINGVARPLLNGKFVFQAGPLDQGFWPDGIYTAPTDDALRSDLQASKDLGFNMVRKHIKVEPQRWFYWADKLGLLVWQDIPNTSVFTEPNATAKAAVEAEIQQIIDEHRSSPAVIMWVVFNESWGDFDIARVTGNVKATDPSRLVNAHSGINFAPGDVGAGDVIDIHDYPGPLAPTPTATRIGALGEFGGNGLKISGHLWNPNTTCCYVNYPDVAKLTSVYVNQINQTRGLIFSKGLSAAVYTEITDVEDEPNGFLTYDRQVKKMDFAKARQANLALVQASPYLPVNTVDSFRVVTPGFTDRFMGQSSNLGITAIVNSSSTTSLKKDASWRVVTGLADVGCYSFESVALPGNYLRHADYRLRVDANNNTDLFRQDATFCTRAALDSSGNVSFESKNVPGYYIRHRDSQLWLDVFQNTTAYRQDASWTVQSAWWRSTVNLELNVYKSLRVTTPNFTNRYARHADSLGYTEVVSSSSSTTLKQDATWRIVTGLADPSCYSFESRNFAGQYLRHADSRIRKDAPDGSQLFREDATFCAVPGANNGVSFAAYNFPARFLRHADTQLWTADGSGGANWNRSLSFEDDISWAVDAPWAP